MRSQQAAGSRVLGKCWRFKVWSHGPLTLTDLPVEGEATCGLEAIRQSAEQPDRSAFSNVVHVSGNKLG